MDASIAAVSLDDAPASDTLPESDSILGDIQWKTIFASAALIWYTVLMALSLLGCMTARKRYRLRPRSPLSTASPASVPGVTILRPLKGLDTNLYENLESTFTQEYPKYELLLCVADENDQAVPVARELLAKYPAVNARVVIGEEIVGVNPKVNNLVRAYREAAHDILWVIDSNITAAPGTLARSVDALVGPSNPPTPPLKRPIALVHHVPFATGSSEPTFGARVETAFLNTNHAKMYLAINAVAVDSCVVGKSNLYRRSELERVDGSEKSIKPPAVRQPGPTGLPAFGRFLAEDNMIGRAFWHELGARHELSCDVAYNTIGPMTVGDYVQRRVRWIRVRRHMVAAATIVEPLTESLMLGVMVSTALHYLIGANPLLVFVLHYAWWIAVDLDVYASLAGHPLPAAQRWSFFTAWALRELIAFPIWSVAIWGDVVEWRGRRYRVMKNGEVERAPEGAFWWASWFSRQRHEPQYEPLLSHS